MNFDENFEQYCGALKNYKNPLIFNKIHKSSKNHNISQWILPDKTWIMDRRSFHSEIDRLINNNKRK